MRIGIAQLNPTVGDLDGNVNRMVAAAEEAAEQGAGMVVYPAHVLTGAPLDGLLTSAEFISDCREHLESFASRTPVLSIVNCPVPVEDDDGDITIAPELLAAGPDGLDSLAVPLLADDDQCPVIEMDGVGSALLLLDNHIADDVEIAGVTVLVEMTADSYGDQTAAPAAWGTMARLTALAQTCHAWVVNVNLVGAADTVLFSGNSTVVDPQGRLVHAASLDAEEVYVLDTEESEPEYENARAAELAPDEIAWRGLVAATRDYVRKNGFSDVAVGVSGGLDSAVVAAIAADALGCGHVHAVFMPGPFTSSESEADARELCANLGVQMTTVPIGPALDAFCGLLADACGGAVEGIAAENLQARVRTVHLMTLANTHGWLVLNTGNKSEAAVGFSTLYGDTAGAFAPLGNVYKTDVRDLAAWRMERGASIPQRCLTKEPSAELYEGARDSDRLPPYDVLDDVLFDYVESNMDADELREEGHDAALVADVLPRVVASEFKRRLEPPAPKLRGRSFAERGWPITNAWRDRS